MSAFDYEKAKRRQNHLMQQTFPFHTQNHPIIHSYTYIHIYIYTYIHIYIYTYIHIHIHMYPSTRRLSHLLFSLFCSFFSLILLYSLFRVFVLLWMTAKVEG
ncbi:hypothetical protein, unlikely [Trypanosoma brucei gambiense DAL972]|uniref:Uncharacterized protein n=1 Tax=Trypanosoma brucei gambiense (strain MHOM/CI/86/DAL972) TaxID=679716 RepID=C9ZSU1_TRYB9|nr:hypothetical protein, unlikely [Trypanosoma brucei gambiense DAL972]CBH12476.1 hypothetical protein, unlikely [Trypanosoma brucei gambiense DAL972]|eukprot:XP_011774756.1 hypothetical protein, unlikely [Trypanosoma brucei gambiense DAL972]